MELNFFPNSEPCLRPRCRLWGGGETGARGEMMEVEPGGGGGEPRAAL